MITKQQSQLPTILSTTTIPSMLKQIGTSLKKKVDDGTISVTYVPTSQKTVDVLTKALFKPMFEKMRDKLGLKNVYYLASRGALTNSKE